LTSSSTVAGGGPTGLLGSLFGAEGPGPGPGATGFGCGTIVGTGCADLAAASCLTSNSTVAGGGPTGLLGSLFGAEGPGPGPAAAGFGCGTLAGAGFADLAAAEDRSTSAAERADTSCAFFCFSSCAFKSCLLFSKLALIFSRRLYGIILPLI